MATNKNRVYRKREGVDCKQKNVILFVIAVAASLWFRSNLYFMGILAPQIIMISDYNNSNVAEEASVAAHGKPVSSAYPKGWVLLQIDPDMYTCVQEEAEARYSGLPMLLRKAYNTASEMKDLGSQVREPDGHKRLDVMMPAIDACPRLTMIGSNFDGSKLICGLDQILGTPEAPCVVYSIGSNNQWDFEADIVKRTNCRVFTFDCTVDGHVPGDIKDRVTFHKICLGSKTVGGEVGSFLPLAKMMSMLGHDHITLLKMDIVCA